MGIYLTQVPTTCSVLGPPRRITFRFNRRKSRNRGKLFYRLLEQAVAVEPVPYKSLVKCSAEPPLVKPQDVVGT